jgi:hypothetical protein
MSVDPEVRLRRVVEEDHEAGTSTSEFCSWLLSRIDYGVQKNHHAWTVIRFRTTRKPVKESPDEIKRKFDDMSALMVGPNKKLWPEIRIYQDANKCVMVNVSHITSVAVVSAYSTKINFTVGHVVIDLPIDWLDLPGAKRNV